MPSGRAGLRLSEAAARARTLCAARRRTSAPCSRCRTSSSAASCWSSALDSATASCLSCTSSGVTLLPSGASACESPMRGAGLAALLLLRRLLFSCATAAARNMMPPGIGFARCSGDGVGVLRRLLAEAARRHRASAARPRAAAAATPATPGSAAAAHRAARRSGSADRSLPWRRRWRSLPALRPPRPRRLIEQALPDLFRCSRSAAAPAAVQLCRRAHRRICCSACAALCGVAFLQRRGDVLQRLVTAQLLRQADTGLRASKRHPDCAARAPPAPQPARAASPPRSPPCAQGAQRLLELCGCRAIAGSCADQLAQQLHLLRFGSGQRIAAARDSAWDDGDNGGANHSASSNTLTSALAASVPRSTRSGSSACDIEARAPSARRVRICAAIQGEAIGCAMNQYAVLSSSLSAARRVGLGRSARKTRAPRDEARATARTAGHPQQQSDQNRGRAHEPVRDRRPRATHATTAAATAISPSTTVASCTRGAIAAGAGPARARAG